MRLTSDIFVSALLRRVGNTGGFGAVLRRGNREAGAVFLVCRDRAGAMILYGPAPQIAYEEEIVDTRRFTLINESIDQQALESWIEREQRFDSDFWVVELEPGNVSLAELVTLAPDF